MGARTYPPKYPVDVGDVSIDGVSSSGKHEIRRHEIDFVVNKASERIYIQSTFAIPDPAIGQLRFANEAHNSRPRVS